MKLPNIGNVSGPERLAAPSASQAERDFGIRMASLSKGSRARMSEVINSGVAQERASIAGAQLQMAEDMADVEIAQATSRAHKSLGDKMIDSLEAYDIRENKTRVHDLKLGYKEASTRWFKEREDAESYPAASIPDSVKTVAGVSPQDAVVPRYKVDAEWHRQTMKEWLSENSSSVTHTALRNDVVAVLEGTEANTYDALVRKSFTQQNLYTLNEVTDYVGRATRNGEYDLALERIVESNLDTKQKNVLMSEVIETKQYTEATSILNLDPANPETQVRQERHLQLLIEDNPGTSGHLEDTTRQGLINSLKSQLTKAQTMKDNQQDAWREQIALESQLLLKDAENKALITDVEQFNAHQQVMLTSPLKSERKLGFDMEQAKRTTQVMSKFYTENLDFMIDQKAAIDKAVTTGRIASGELSIVMKGTFSTLQDDMNQATQDIKNDPVKYMREHQIADVKMFDTNDVVNSVQNALAVAGVALKKYGQADQFMEKDQYRILSDKIGAMGLEMRPDPETGVLGPSETATFLGDLYKGFSKDGSKMAAFLEPLKELSDNPAFAVAAQRYKSDPMLTTDVMKGVAILNPDSPLYQAEIVTKVRPELNTLLNKDVGAAFEYNRIEQAAMKETVLAMYAYMSLRAGDLSGEYQKDRMDAALYRVTGGMVNYNGSKFSSPVPGLDNSEKVERFVSDLTPDYLVGLKNNFSSETVMGHIQDGRIQLKQVGANRFHLYDTVSRHTIPNEQGTNYVFDFHKPGETVSGIAKTNLALRKHEALSQPFIGPSEEDVKAAMGKTVDMMHTLLKPLEDFYKKADIDNIKGL